MTFHTYQSCSACQGGPKPGTVFVMEGLILKYPYISSLGIYACRDVANTTTKSIHACGRAGDPKIPTLSGGAANTSLGHPPLKDLIDNANELGIMGLIYNRVRYDKSSPRGRYYTGKHPHWDHIHYEQTDHHARTLTRARVYEILKVEERAMGALSVLELQKTLNKMGARDFEGKTLKEDDLFGPRTESAWINGMKMGSGSTVDGTARTAANRANQRLDQLKNI